MSAYGFIDRTGAVVIPATWTSTYPFKFGIAKAGTKQIDWLIYPLSYIVPTDPYYTSWTYIDPHGKVLAYARQALVAQTSIPVPPRPAVVKR